MTNVDTNQSITTSDAQWSEATVVQSDALPIDTRSTIRDPNTGELVHSPDECKQPAKQEEPQ